MPKYLYQQPKWPAFEWDRQALSAQLAEVSFHQGLLIGRLEALGFGERKEATLEALIQEVRKSSEIEGELLDEMQIRSSIGKRLGMDVAGLPAADRHVDGIVEIVLDATQNHSQPLTAERLWTWHALLFPDPRHRSDRFTVGGWRTDSTGPMQVVSGAIGRERVHYEAPAADALDREMAQLLGWFESEGESVIKAGLAHLWFETLHPFDDGNGRIGRAVMDMALARSERRAWRGYSMSAQIRKERSAYYDALERTQKGSLDVTDWLSWFLGCLDRAIKSSEQILNDVMQRTRFWQAHAAVSFNERQRKVLSRILEGWEGKLTNAKWAKLGKCSHDTALRDLNELVAKGVLAKEEAGGRSTSYALVRPEE